MQYQRLAKLLREREAKTLLQNQERKKQSDAKISPTDSHENPNVESVHNNVPVKHGRTVIQDDEIIEDDIKNDSIEPENTNGDVIIHNGIKIFKIERQLHNSKKKNYNRCLRCGRIGHYANKCYSLTTDVSGHKL